MTSQERYGVTVERDENGIPVSIGWERIEEDAQWTVEPKHWGPCRGMDVLCLRCWKCVDCCNCVKPRLVHL